MNTDDSGKRGAMARSPSLGVSLAALMVMLLVWASGAQADSATVVGPGASIQAAVDAADPGDTILVFGTHRENVAIQTDGLTLRGVGAVIVPPAAPAVHACFDPTEVDEAVHGICVIGDVDFDTGEISRYVEGVTIRGFSVRGFTGSGLSAIGASGTTFTDNVVSNNGDAGITALQSKGTRLLSNQASGSRFGIFILGALGGEIVGNSVHDNCVGVFAFLDAAQFRIATNAINRNTRLCPATIDEWPALSGVGVLLIGATSNTISANLILGNVPAGDTAFSGGVVVVAVPDDPPASDNVVKHNIILRNDPDIFWDETGTGNVFANNLCQTSTPPDLCG
jgi:parallel beta-helix repeat protein